jgi:hypothetical protein
MKLPTTLVINDVTYTSKNAFVGLELSDIQALVDDFIDPANVNLTHRCMDVEQLLRIKNGY